MRKTLLAIGMALASCAAIAATEVVDGITWTYEVIDGEASVRGIPTSTTGAITIPSTLGDCPVTSIGNQAFRTRAGLTSVTIPNIVTSIGNSAFYNCRGLTSVTIPSSVTSIGSLAFSGCSGLTNVTLREGVTSIGSSAFSRCSGLTSVSIPSSVTYVGSSAFIDCDGIKDVTVPGWRCEIDFTSVTNLVISDGTTGIEKYAFSDCSGLTGVSIPDSVTNIGVNAFNGCSGLTSVTIPNSVIAIGGAAFVGCSGMLSFNVEEGNPNYKSEGGFLLTKDGKSLVAGINGDVTVPPGVTRIEDYAFSYHSGLTSVAIPSSVTSIGSSAFYGCSGLASVTIPNSVTSIGNSAFCGCSGLTNVTIPNSVTSIGNSAFCGCSGLMSVAIPSSVTSIGSGAFCDCVELTNVTLEGDAPMSGDGIFEGTPLDMIVHVKGNSSGWTQWNGRVIRFDADSGSGAAATSVNVNMTITNVIVHYIQTSELSPMAAPVTKDVGIVNVMTEVKGGNVSIPESWATNWPAFKATFGEDFSDALTRQTGKFDAGGKPMMVWQDFVAGTDPTDKDDVFRASITTDANGNLIISYTPKLSEAEKAKRKYTTWGKVKLHDEKWVEIPAGHEDDYNFFKVTVEMK